MSRFWNQVLARAWKRSGKKLRRRPFYMVEMLENRQLLSVVYSGTGFSLVGQTLNYSGGTVNNIATTVGNQLILNATAPTTFSVSGFKGFVQLNGTGSGNNYSVIGNNGTNSATITINDAGGTGTLAVSAPVSEGMTVVPGGVNLGNAGADSIVYSGVTTLGITGKGAASDILTISDNVGADAIVVNDAGTSGGLTSVTGFSGLSAAFTYSSFHALTVSGNNSNTLAVNVAASANVVASTAVTGLLSVTELDYNSLAQLTLTGGTSDTFTINNPGTATVINGGGGTNVFHIQANQNTLTLTGGGGSSDNTFNMDANNGPATITGGGAANHFTIQANQNSNLIVNASATGTDDCTIRNSLGFGASAVFNAGGGNDTFHVVGALAANITVQKNAGILTGTASLIVDGTTSPETIVVAPARVTGIGANQVNYSGLQNLTVNGKGGSDSFRVTGTSASVMTTLVGDAALGGSAVANSFAVLATTTPLTIQGNVTGSTINISSTAPTHGGLLNTIQGSINLIGGGGEIVNIDDSGDTTARTDGNLTASALTGLTLGTGGITYSNLGTLNLALGSGGNTFAVQGTSGTTVITVAGGPNTFTVGTTLAQIQGALTIHGQSADTLTVSDTASVTAHSGTLTASTLTGLGMVTGGITFDGMATFNGSLATAVATTLNVNIAGTSSLATTLTSASGLDTINVLSDSTGTTTLNTSGTDTVNVRAINGTTAVNPAVGSSNIVNVGSTAGLGTNGNLAGIHAGLTINGRGADTLNIDDRSNSTASQTGTLTATALTGLDLGANTLSFPATLGGLSALNLKLGSGGTALTVNVTSGTTAVTITSTSSLDVLNVLADHGTTVLNMTGTAIANIRTINGATTINAGAGAGTINVGSTAGSSTAGNLAGIRNSLAINGGGGDILNLDDRTNVAATQTGTLTATTLTGLDLAGNTVTFGGLAALNLKLGTGGVALTINVTTGTTALTVTSTVSLDVLTVVADSGPTTLNVAGKATVNLRTINGATTVNAGAGAGTVNVGSTAGLGSAGNLAGIRNSLAINGGGGDILNIDDRTNVGATQTGTLTATTLTGLDLAGNTITFGGISALNLKLGTGGVALTINVTTGTTALTVTSTSSLDVLTVLADSGSTTLNITGTATANIRAISAATTINAGAGAGTINVGSTAGLGTNGNLAGIRGNLTINGGGGDVLNLDDRTNATAAQTGTLTATALTGLDLAANTITFNGLAALNLKLGSGGNTLNIRGTAAPTAITVMPGTAGNVFDLGSTAGAAPAAAGKISAILGALTITGKGADQLNVDDTGTSIAGTATLTATTLTGLAMAAGGITYSGMGTVNINLGSGGNTLTIAGTSTATTNVNTGSGSDTLFVQTTTGATNVNLGAGNNATTVANAHRLNGIAGALTLVGGGSDQLLVDDTANAAVTTNGLLTATALTGLGMGAAGITYSGIGTLGISLGSGGNTFTISNTAAKTSTTLNSGAGSDVVTLLADAGSTTINTQGGAANTVNIRSTSALTAVNTPTGVNTITISSTAGALSPTPGSLGGIAGRVTITGSNADTLTLDDTASTVGRTGTLTPTTINGLGMGAGGVVYGGIQTLHVTLGGGNNAFNIQDINASTHTVVNGGAGANNTVVARFAQDFAGNLTLGSFAAGSLTVGRDFTGNLTASGPGTLLSVAIGRSLTAAGVLTVGSGISSGNISTIAIGSRIDGSILVHGGINTLLIGTTGSGVLGATAVIHTLTAIAKLTVAIRQPGSQLIVGPFI